MNANRSPSLAQAFAELGRACAKVAAALAAEAGERAAATPSSASAAPAARPKRNQRPLDLAAAESVSPISGGTRRKVLLALAQLGRPLNMDELAFFAGLSRTSGGLGQALADLRRDEEIEGPGAAMSILPAGLAELGEYTPLPTGHALFEFWARKLGGTCEKVIRSLRNASAPLDMDQLARETGLSRTSGGLGQALADLRKMRLITGGGKAMQLSPDFRRAIEPTISVFDKSSNRTVKVDRSTGHAR